MTETVVPNDCIMTIPPRRSSMNIGGEHGLTINLCGERPNIVWRLMQYLMLGIRWERLPNETI